MPAKLARACKRTARSKLDYDGSKSHAMQDVRRCGYRSRLHRCDARQHFRLGFVGRDEIDEARKRRQRSVGRNWGRIEHDAGTETPRHFGRAQIIDRRALALQHQSARRLQSLRKDSELLVAGGKIGAGDNRYRVSPRRIDENRSHTCRVRVEYADIVGRNSEAHKFLPDESTEKIVAHIAQQADTRAKPVGRNRLVGTFAAEIERIASAGSGFAHRGRPIGIDTHIRIDASENADVDGRGHLH